MNTEEDIFQERPEDSSFPEETSWTDFKDIFEKKRDSGEKIRIALSFMESTLILPTTTAKLHCFWETQKLCKPHFKQSMKSSQHQRLWDQYLHLMKEARHLSSVLGEQNDFLISQIDLAIDALERETQEIVYQPENHKPSSKLDIPKSVRSILSDSSFYQARWEWLLSLKSLISRSDSLKKELSDSNIRMSQKNKRFKRLTKLGHLIFPWRRKLVQEIGDCLLNDLSHYEEKQFLRPSSSHPDARMGSFRFAYEEIKGLQRLSKQFPLNPPLFSAIRDRLNLLWNRTEQEEQKQNEEGGSDQPYQEPFRSLSKSVEEFRTRCSTTPPPMKEEIFKKGNDLLEKIQKKKLDDRQARSLLHSLQAAQNEAMKRAEKYVDQSEKREKERFNHLQRSLSTLMEKVSDHSLFDLQEEEKRFIQESASLSINPFHRYFLEFELTRLRSAIFNKIEEESESLSELKQLHQEQEQFVDLLRKHLELYRKEMDRSGLDFEMSMSYHSLYDRAKGQLRQEMETLQRLRDKIIEASL